jgi:molybdopterin-guanine dinucleotide biosynthesis protein A
MSGSPAVVILAGGEGARIGGNKPLRMLGEKRLIDLAFEQARCWSAVVAVAVRHEGQIKPVGIPVIRDEPGVEGPLGGLIAGLRFARGVGAELLLTVPADMPFLPSDLRSRLHSAIVDRGCALASSGGHVHPVCGLWRSSSLDQAYRYCADGRRSLKGFAATIGCVEVEWPSQPDPFFNINRAADLAEAERRLQR